MLIMLARMFHVLMLYICPTHLLHFFSKLQVIWDKDCVYAVRLYKIMQQYAVYNMGLSKTQNYDC